MLTDPLHDIDLKIQWANSRFRDFQRFHRHWSRSDTNRVVVKRDPQTNEILYCLPDGFYVPRDFALIAGDALQNCRTALDYLACALIRASEGPTANIDHASFPIFDHGPSTPKDEASFAKKIDRFPSGARNIIHSIKPYHGGDDILWRLHELNRREKHRLLFTVGGYLHNWGVVQHMEASGMSLARMERLARAYAEEDETWLNMRKVSFPLNAGNVIIRDPPESKVNENLQVDIQIALNEPGICDGEPVFSILWRSIGRTNEVVRMFDGMY
jgi:hypothetical protein